jgi:hypothetical protein
MDAFRSFDLLATDPTHSGRNRFVLIFTVRGAAPHGFATTALIWEPAFHHPRHFTQAGCGGPMPSTRRKALRSIFPKTSSRASCT